MVKVGEVRVTLEPCACERFYFLDKSSHTHCRRQTYEHVYVVGHASYAVNLDIPVVGNTEHVSIKLTLEFFGNGSFTTIGTKDYVV